MIECSTKVVFTDLASGKLSTCSHFPDSISNNSTESNAPFWLYPPMMRIAVLLTGTVQKLNKYDHILYPESLNIYIHIWIFLLFDFKHKFCDLTYTFLEPFPILVLAPMYLICRCTSVRMNCKIMSYVSQNNLKIYLMFI